MPKAKTPRISRAMMRRSLRLLDMEYKVSEIAQELKITEKTIYQSWLIAGMPCRRDSTGHLWLHGPAVAKWISLNAPITKYTKDDRHVMEDDEAYCMSCRQPVKMERVTRREKWRGAVRVHAVGVCGHKVIRMMRKETKA